MAIPHADTRRITLPHLPDSWLNVGAFPRALECHEKVAERRDRIDGLRFTRELWHISQTLDKMDDDERKATFAQQALNLVEKTDDPQIFEVQARLRHGTHFQ